MADADEDVSHLGLQNEADNDPTEEAQDFRFLDKLIGANDVAHLTLPKRGEKDFESHSTNLQLDTLETSRRAMHGVLSWQRTHTQKNHILARYHPETNTVCVEKVKSQHFQTIGRSKGGKEWLLPEEALFMIERGSLDCRWPVKKEEGDEQRHRTENGAPMSLQAAYAAFIGYEEGVGGKLTLEMYNVYAGLKRSGFVVFRVGAWDQDRGDLLQQAPSLHDAGNGSPGIFTRFFSELWRRLSQPTYTIAPESLSSGPLIKLGLYRSYTDIFRLMQIVPAHDRNAPPDFILPSAATNPFRVHFDVYRTTGGFRKTQRGPPDFQVCVINARETPIPTGAQLNDLFAQVPDDRLNMGANYFQKLKHGTRNVILAVVDNGIPSYIRVADAAFQEIKIYERSSAGGRSKGGRGRSGGRGRGRGRGR